MIHINHFDLLPLVLGVIALITLYFPGVANNRRWPRLGLI